MINRFDTVSVGVRIYAGSRLDVLQTRRFRPHSKSIGLSTSIPGFDFPTSCPHIRKGPLQLSRTVVLHAECAKHLVR